MRTIVLQITAVIFICGSVLAQSQPVIPCPNYFRYVNDGNDFHGEVTVKNLPVATTKVEVQFVQRETIKSGFKGRLSLVEDLKKTQINLENGTPIVYRVDFPIPNTVPQLLLIVVNGVNVCVGTRIPPPSTTFKLQHTFIPSVTITNDVEPPPIIPPIPDTLFNDPIKNDNSPALAIGNSANLPNLPNGNSGNSAPAPNSNTATIPIGNSATLSVANSAGSPNGDSLSLPLGNGATAPTKLPNPTQLTITNRNTFVEAKFTETHSLNVVLQIPQNANIKI